MLNLQHLELYLKFISLNKTQSPDGVLMSSLIKLMHT